MVSLLQHYRRLRKREMEATTALNEAAALPGEAVRSLVATLQQAEVQHNTVHSAAIETIRDAHARQLAVAGREAHTRYDSAAIELERWAAPKGAATASWGSPAWAEYQPTWMGHDLTLVRLGTLAPPWPGASAAPLLVPATGPAGITIVARSAPEREQALAALRGLLLRCILLAPPGKARVHLGALQEPFAGLLAGLGLATLQPENSGAPSPEDSPQGAPAVIEIALLTDEELDDTGGRVFGRSAPARQVVPWRLVERTERSDASVIERCDGGWAMRGWPTTCFGLDPLPSAQAIAQMAARYRRAVQLRRLRDEDLDGLGRWPVEFERSRVSAGIAAPLGLGEQGDKVELRLQRDAYRRTLLIGPEGPRRALLESLLLRLLSLYPPSELGILLLSSDAPPEWARDLPPQRLELLPWERYVAAPEALVQRLTQASPAANAARMTLLVVDDLTGLAANAPEVWARTWPALADGAGGQAARIGAALLGTTNLTALDAAAQGEIDAWVACDLEADELAALPCPAHTQHALRALPPGFVWHCARQDDAAASEAAWSCVWAEWPRLDAAQLRQFARRVRTRAELLL